jgi:hypothetical protein
MAYQRRRGRACSCISGGRSQKRAGRCADMDILFSSTVEQNSAKGKRKLAVVRNDVVSGQDALAIGGHRVLRFVSSSVRRCGASSRVIHSIP